MRTGKFKIIKESDGNGKCFYELWFEHKLLWVKRWCIVKDQVFRASIRKRFESPEQIYEYIHSKEITRTVYKEGVLP